MVGRLEQSFGRLRQQICVDSLTGVLTRAGFTEEFDRLAEQGGGGGAHRPRDRRRRVDRPFCRRRNCAAWAAALGQGYLLGRPMAAEDFTRAAAEMGR